MSVRNPPRPELPSLRDQSRYLIDQNISSDLVEALYADGAYAEHTRIIGLDTAYDLEIFRYACERGFAIITHDHDFAHNRAQYGPPYHGIVFVELPQRWSVEDMARRIVSALHPLRFESIANRLVVIEPSDVTVRDQE